MTRKFVSKAKINLNKYWHKFEEILTAAGEDIKSMSSTYTEFIIAQKYKYCTMEPTTVDLLRSTKMTLLSAVRDQTPNNLHDELNSYVSKNNDDDDDLMALKNTNETGSSYRTFTTDDLYYGVNLNTNLTIPMGVYKAKRCSCYIERDCSTPPPQQRKRPASTSYLPTAQFIAATTVQQRQNVSPTPPPPSSSPVPRFSHRNIRLSVEDCQNLENEAFQVYKKFSIYDTSF